MNDTSKPHTPEPNLFKESSAQPVVLDSRTLFSGKQQVFIRHDGELYRLCLTRQNRLILTK